jgi:hypothetical protein
MRWTRQRLARDGIAGLVERLVSDHRRADERCCSVRQNRVVLTPRRWRQVRGVASALPGLDKTYPRDDGGKTARSPGRARHKPLKPLRAGMPGDSGVLVVTRVRSITAIAHEAAGATGTRHSPRPPWGRKINANLGRFAPRDRETAFVIGTVICGRPLLASSFLTLRTIWSASVICPACWCGTMAAGPDEFRLPRSLSLRRARGS